MDWHEGRVVNVQPNFIEVQIAHGKIVEVNRRVMPEAARGMTFAPGQRLRVRGQLAGPAFRSVEAIEVAEE